MSLVRWRGEMPEGGRVPDSYLSCRKEAVCGWVGRFYESIPLGPQTVITAEPDWGRIFLTLLSTGFEQQSDMTKALEEFDQFLLNHPFGDPDSKGKADLKIYIARLTQLRLFISMIDTLGLSAYRDSLMESEIARLFPPVTPIQMRKVT